MHPQRIIVISAAVVGIVSGFLPWIGLVHPLQGHKHLPFVGVVNSAFFLLALFLVLMGKKDEPVRSWKRGIAVILAVFAVMYALRSISMPGNASFLRDGIVQSGVTIHVLFGVYVSLASAIAFFIGLCLFGSKQQKQRELSPTNG